MGQADQLLREHLEARRGGPGSEYTAGTDGRSSGPRRGPALGREASPPPSEAGGSGALLGGAGRMLNRAEKVRPAGVPAAIPAGPCAPGCTCVRACVLRRRRGAMRGAEPRVRRPRRAARAEPKQRTLSPRAVSGPRAARRRARIDSRLGAGDGTGGVVVQLRLDKVRRERVADMERTRAEQEAWEAREAREREMQRLRAVEQVPRGPHRCGPKRREAARSSGPVPGVGVGVGGEGQGGTQSPAGWGGRGWGR